MTCAGESRQLHFLKDSNFLKFLHYSSPPQPHASNSADVNEPEEFCWKIALSSTSRMTKACVNSPLILIRLNEVCLGFKNWPLSFLFIRSFEVQPKALKLLLLHLSFRYRLLTANKRAQIEIKKIFLALTKLFLAQHLKHIYEGRFVFTNFNVSFLTGKKNFRIQFSII